MTPRKKSTSRPPKFKFYLDENFPLPTGKFLKSLGHTVIFGVNALGKIGATDFAHIAKSTKESAIMLGFDRDFVINKDLKLRISKSPGVVLITATNTDPNTAEKILRKVLKNLTPNKIKGKICLASVDKIEYF